jgi:regulatory protein
MLEIVKIIYYDNHLVAELSDSERLMVPLDLAAGYSLVTGKSLSNEEYRQLKEESDRYSCYQKALGYLASGGKTGHEVRRNLKKKGFSGQYIDEALEKLESRGYVNDFDFTVDYLRMKSASKTVGANYLKSKLYQKGVKREVINRALKETAVERSLEDILVLAEKKFASVMDKPDPYNRVAAFLYRRGFETEIINKVIALLKKK